MIHDQQTNKIPFKVANEKLVSVFVECQACTGTYLVYQVTWTTRRPYMYISLLHMLLLTVQNEDFRKGSRY